MGWFMKSPYNYYRDHLLTWLHHLGVNITGSELPGDNETIPGDCSDVTSYNWTDRCHFVEHNENCLDVDGFVNYVSLTYCTAGQQLFPLGVILFLIWLVILFVGIGVSADQFFCPSIEVISKTFRLSQNIAGVTIMALGNGAPDIFSSLAGVSASRPSLVFGALFGAAVFVTSVVAGSVALTQPFKSMERPFLRDVTFFLAAGFWAFYIFWKEEIHLYDSLGFLGLYLVYIVVVVVGRFIHSKTRTSPPYFPQEADIDYSVETRPGTGEEGRDSRTRHHHPTLTGDPPEVRLLPEPPTATPVLAHLTLLGHALNPIDREEWSKGNWFWKSYYVFQAPVKFLFIITIPKMAYDAPQENWCKFLSVVHCLVSPLFAVFATSCALDEVGSTGIQVYELVSLVGFFLGVLVALTSRSATAPRYHVLFGFAGFAVSIVWIYIIANELVSLLKAFGVMFGLTDAILGLTVLAWGNSLADLIADTAMAKRGQPRTGFSACFGGPLFNLLLGVGLPFTLLSLSNGGQPVPVEFDLMTVTLSGGLGVSLLFSYLVLPLLKFQVSRWYGLTLLLIYSCFLGVSLTIEFTLL